MVDTTMRHAIEDQVLELCAEDSQWLKVWGETAIKIRRDEIDPWLVDAVMYPRKTEHADCHAFLLVRGEIIKGEVAYTKVHVGEQAYGNDAGELIQNALNNLPFPFRSTFNPSVGIGRGYDDGFFAWDASVKMDAYQNGQHQTIDVAPGYVPLEVGSTDSSKTFEHVFLGGGVARWPYGSDWVIVLKRIGFSPKVAF